MAEHSISLERFIDVLNKTCESDFIYSTQDHRKEIEKYKYIMRRALLELNQLIKEINANATHNHSSSGFICSWLSLLEMELKYSFIQLVPFTMTRLDVMHDDFVSVVHDVERSMRGSDSRDIHEVFGGKIVALESQVVNSLDGTARVLLREFACCASNGVKKREVIVCPSSSALMAISSKATQDGGMGLKKWMDEKVFPLLIEKLDEVDVAESIIVFIGTEEETKELSFWLESTSL